jgi:hypothetical protein
LETAKSSIEKQWEEAITAMSKRDKAFQSTEDHKQAMNLKYLELEKELTLVKDEKNELTRNLSAREQGTIPFN